MTNAENFRAVQMLVITLVWMVAERPELHEHFKRVLARVREANLAVELGTAAPDASLSRIDKLLAQFLPPQLRP